MEKNIVLSILLVIIVAIYPACGVAHKVQPATGLQNGNKPGVDKKKSEGYFFMEDTVSEPARIYKRGNR